MAYNKNVLNVVDFGPNGPDWNCFLTLRLLLSIEIDPTAKLQILVKNLEKILKIKTQKVVFIVQKTLRAKTTLHSRIPLVHFGIRPQA